MALLREDYMNGRCTHREYYASIAKTARLQFLPDSGLVRDARKALAAGDEHLNTIPLRRWDLLGSMTPGLPQAFKAHDDSDTLAGRVCVLKEAVKQAAELPDPSPEAP